MEDRPQGQRAVVNDSRHNADSTRQALACSKRVLDAGGKPKTAHHSAGAFFPRIRRLPDAIGAEFARR